MVNRADARRFGRNPIVIISPAGQTLVWNLVARGWDSCPPQYTYMARKWGMGATGKWATATAGDNSHE